MCLQYRCLNVKDRSENVVLMSDISGRDRPFFNTSADKISQNGDIVKLPVTETEPREGADGDGPSHADHVTEQTHGKPLPCPPYPVRCYVATPSPSSWGNFPVRPKTPPATSAPSTRVAGGQPLAGAWGRRGRGGVGARLRPVPRVTCHPRHAAGTCGVTGPFAVEGESSGTRPACHFWLEEKNSHGRAPWAFKQTPAKRF